MILICVGSCLYTILSKESIASSDRIASNIVTGIGFIGAGVIFKEGISVKDYRIKTTGLGHNFKEEFELFFLSKDMTFSCMKTVKEENDAVYLYRISSPDRNYDAVNNFLLKNVEV